MNMSFNYGFTSETSFVNFIRSESFVDMLVVLLAKLDLEIMWTYCFAYKTRSQSSLDLLFRLQNQIQKFHEPNVLHAKLGPELLWTQCFACKTKSHSGLTSETQFNSFANMVV
jgi:hypothetical protein